MASAHTLPLALDRCFRRGFFRANDPGASGEIPLTNKSFAICEVDTSTAESRSLPSASGYPVGAQLRVILRSDGGNLTITGGNDGNVVLDTTGQFVDFTVVNAGTEASPSLVWKSTTPFNDLNLLIGSGAAPASSGLLMGGGTTAAPNTTDVADAKFLEFRCQSTATSGDNRLAYLRYELASTGGGECLRAFTKLAATVGTARGAHISLDIDDSPAGQVTGLGVGVDAQIAIGNGALSSGTFAVVNAEIFTTGDDADPAGNRISCFRAVNNGSSNGKADVDDDAAIFAVDGFSAASGTAHAVSSTGLNELNSGTGIGLRITVDGAIYYIPAIPAAGWN